jgi:hypothetical protein
MRPSSTLPDQPTQRKTWKFFRAGTVDQVVLANGNDLEQLASLDKKLWVALACPTRGLEIDERTLDFVDNDRDGRIRPPEILSAIAWAREVFSDLDDLFQGGDSVPVASIRTDTAVGRDIRDAVTRIVNALGRTGAASISLADVADTEKTFTQRALNGDGIVPADSAVDDETKAAITDALATVGSAVDRSGKPGIDQGLLDTFFARVQAYAAWLEQEAAVLTLGPDTSAAALSIAAVGAKIDDYFVRCRLAAFDGRVIAALNGTEERIAAFAGRVLALEDSDVAALPLARVEAGADLTLSAVNPAWTARIASFVSAAIVPILGGPRPSCSERDWAIIQERIAPYEAWLASRPADDALDKLGRDRIVALARGHAYERVSALVAEDAGFAAESGQLEAVEKMIRLRRDFVTLLKNFVNFADFYGKKRAAFQAGTLYIDGRSCELCLPVHDVTKHATLAGLSNAYLAYCDCTRKRDAEKRTIVAAVTAGDVDNLMVGRNGVFYDRKGDDWDAAVTKVVENPISVRQAFWAPYKRFVRLIQDQLSKRATAAEMDANKRLGQDATAVVAAAADEPKPETVEPKRIDVGTVAAIGVAVGGIATFFSSIVATVLGLGMWMPLGIVALVLAISGPSMLIAWLKLRQRNIGPLLDANGWAVNAFARVNVPFGGALTSVAALPPGASRALKDPFAEKKRPWGVYVFVLVLVSIGAAWLSGQVDEYLPDEMKASTVLHRQVAAPAVAPAPHK